MPAAAAARTPGAASRSASPKQANCLFRSASASSLPAAGSCGGTGMHASPANLQAVSSSATRLLPHIFGTLASV